MTTSQSRDGDWAQRASVELDLRELCRQVLALEAGDVAESNYPIPAIVKAKAYLAALVDSVREGKAR